MNEIKVLAKPHAVVLERNGRSYLGLQSRYEGRTQAYTWYGVTANGWQTTDDEVAGQFEQFMKEQAQ